MDYFFKWLPHITQWISNMIWYYILQKKQHFTQKIYPNQEQLTNPESSILLVRSWNSHSHDSNSSSSSNKEDDDIQNERVDAVLDYACSQNTAFHLRYKKRYFVNAKEEFKLSPDIMGIMQQIQYDPKDNSVIYVEFLVKSKRYNLHSLRAWVDKVYHDYQNKKKNQLGDQRYFFQEIPSFVRRDLDGNIVFESLPKRLCFKMTPFHTFKSLKNVFGEYMETVRKRIILFRDHPEWYEKRGIPYTLGILLHGTPGCGKTSCIKAIAKDMNRHIFSFSLRDVTTQSQLNNLFFDESIQILSSNGETTFIHIPLDQRLYVIEDIDCMSDVVLDRSTIEPHIPQKTMEQPVPIEFSDSEDEIDLPTYSYSMPQQTTPTIPISSYDSSSSFGSSLQEVFTTLRAQQLTNPPRYLQQQSSNNRLTEQQPQSSNNRSTQHSSNRNNTSISTQKKTIYSKPSEANNERLTLSYLLNLIDGVLETPGRILIITTNYPERLDKALIRPGRIDLNIEVKKASKDILHKMFATYYELSEQDMTQYTFTDAIHEKFSPAEVLQILGNHYEQPQLAYQEFKRRDSEKEKDGIKSISLDEDESGNDNMVEGKDDMESRGNIYNH
jgi:hypothetical protein